MGQPSSIFLVSPSLEFSLCLFPTELDYGIFNSVADVKDSSDFFSVNEIHCAL